MLTSERLLAGTASHNVAHSHIHNSVSLREEVVHKQKRLLGVAGGQAVSAKQAGGGAGHR